MFQPAIPLGGYAGWRFLQRTRATQQEVFSCSPEVRRDVDHFKKKIGHTLTADQLVEDRQLLKVALSAYGLEDDLNNRFFIKRILSDGTTKRDALANRLADKRYTEFSKAFGFDSPPPNTILSGFAEKVLTRYQNKAFQSAVGKVNGEMRLAMNLKSGLEEIAAKNGKQRTEWLTIMGTPPLRQVFDTALGMPKGFGALSLDQQYNQYKRRAKQVFGTDKVSDFSKPEKREELVRMFLVRSEVKQFTARTSSAQTALTLLSSIRNNFRTAG